MTDHERTRTSATRPADIRPASPFNVSLEQQRKRAKELLRELRSGEAGALLRFRTHHPCAKDLSDAAIVGRLARLAEAQLVVARELDLRSWPRLKAHALALQQARESILGAHAPDADTATLHVRCGSDLRAPLREAGFLGDFLEYSDPLCQGPVVADGDWPARRAAFVAQAYGARSGQGSEQVAAKLEGAEAGLRAAAGRYARVVLWVEHDSFDQLVLARCLARFAQVPPRRLELVSVDRYPGSTRFIGLGQLPPEALRLLWDRREALSAGQAAAGRAVWDALRGADPIPLALLARGVPGLPYMAAAVQRHCQELPWVGDGLGLTERLVLEVLSEGPRTVGEVFRALVLEREPLPWLGDLMLLHVLDGMGQVREPVFTRERDGGQRDWPEERLAITGLGRAVLAGKVDWLSLSPPERWLGGVRLLPGVPCWRWNDRTGMPVLV